MMRRYQSVILITASMCFALPARGAPQPGIAASSWSLNLHFHDPQRIAVQHRGDNAPTTYWYFLFTVTNNTGQDVQFFPSFRIVTDTIEKVDGGDRVRPSVYDAIAARHRREYPFMAPLPKVTGLLLQGEDNARTSVAIFRDFDKQASKFVVYVSGLSGDVERVSNPDFDPKKPASDSNARSFMLRRTLAIQYDLPGDEVSRGRAKPTRRSRIWVMR